nr:hypothetical protein [Glycomyces sp. L485]
MFIAAIELPVDPAPEVATAIVAGEVSDVGERLVHTLVGIWEGPHQAKLIAVVRSGLSKPSMTLMLKQLFEHRILGTVIDSFGDRIDHHRFRANLVGSQMFGLICTRYILKLEPIASLDADTLAAAVGPTINRYLTMPVDDLAEKP